jgi:hypothetical protein
LLVAYANFIGNIFDNIQVVRQDSRKVDLSERLRALSVQRSTIALEEVTEEGTYSQILRGVFKTQKTVFIKTTKGMFITVLHNLISLKQILLELLDFPIYIFSRS